MQRIEPPLIAIAICLAALAGFVDALAFMSLGGFFASFMSGNSTRLGVSLATGASDNALLAGALVLSFVSGVMLASVIVQALPGRDKPAAMALLTALLVAAGLVADLGLVTAAGLSLATAMGVGHLLLSREAGVQSAGAGLTASLVRMGERLAGALMGDADRWGWLQPLLLWTGFIAGAALGAGACQQIGLRSLWLVAVAAAALTLWLGSRARQQRSGRG
jgi:uncharacterized membrane protein YoaK (UPF0700 family)